MTSLARRLGAVALIFYGIGDILGAGIYALVGKVVTLAGPGAWITFLLAAVAAILTAMSYAELTSRFPVNAGAAAYVARAFGGKLLPTLAGVFVLGSGLVSAATVTVAFSGYLKELLPVPDFVAKLFLTTGLSFLSFWGIAASSRFNMLLTTVEAAGLLAVIGVGFSNSSAEAFLNWMSSSLHTAEWGGIFAGVTVAFYAYIGFEDLSNLAEEAKRPERDLPRAILTAIVVSTVIYLFVTLALQLNVSQAEIHRSETPLLLVFQKAGIEAWLKYFALVALLAITNTGLTNLIMASRLIYGLSREKFIPSIFSTVHPRLKTPWVGILTAYLALLLLVFTGGLKALAQTTSLLILVVFIMVHASLLLVKWRKQRHEGIQFPWIFPCLGLITCLTFVFYFPWEVYLRSLIWLALALLLWFFSQKLRFKSRSR